MDIDQGREFARSHHRAVLHTYRRSGTAQLSPVTVGVAADGRVMISSRETAMKVRNLRRDRRAAVCVFTDRFFGEWVQLDGTAEIVALPEAMPLLEAYYRDISGEHPDWDDYRAAMARERRVAVLIDVERAGPDRSG